MARARPGLAKAVNEILARHGANGKSLSLRQAERHTGLSPATIGELAKGNARTAETVCRFAEGLGEDVERLLLLAGFPPIPSASPSPGDKHVRPDLPVSDPLAALDPETRLWLLRWGHAFAQLPSCRERELFLEILCRDTQLLESFITRFLSARSSEGGTESDKVCEEADGRRTDLGDPESAGGGRTTAA